MKVLVINAGSSSLKYQLIDMDDPIRQMELMTQTLKKDTSRSQTIRDKAYNLAEELTFRPDYIHADDEAIEQGDDAYHE